MPTLGSMAKALEQQLKDKARQLGFDACGIAAPEVPAYTAAGLEEFVRAGFHGSMHWLADTLARRRDPRALMPRANSAIVCAMSYAPPCGHDPLARARDPRLANISLYAARRDYHDVIKGKLKHLAQWLVSRTGADVKVFVDTAPLLERPLAQQAGIGWQGRHTCAVSRRLGGWFFIGVILTSAVLTPDAPAENHCGSCRRCLDVCPTQAFVRERVLDARRCISYLTIEHKGPIARALRPRMGNRVFGCDDCIAVCPWNKFAQAVRETRLQLREDLARLTLPELLKLNEADWRKLFAKTPVRRAGFDRFMANVLIACANTRAVPAQRLHELLKREIFKEYPLARAMLVWALAQLLPPAAFAQLRARHLPAESHPWVRDEWQPARHQKNAQEARQKC